jgi:antitoxin VapB
MICFCARRWGLTASITRFVHFGPMPGELAERFAAVTQVNAQLQAATREGVDAAELYEIARSAYASARHGGGETMHHQGGAAGYLEREWVARPEGTEVVRSPQAFAWNPSLHGAKVEDTVILQNGSIEVLTATPELPVTETHLNGVSYRAAGVLIR